jgi:glucose/mannose-6-phosphate isomerase
MREALKKFPEQFLWEPEIKNAGAFQPRQHVLLAGMGGSHLAADIMLSYDPALPLSVHADYGLPHVPEPNKTLVITSSYSGNTEEVLDAYKIARAKNLPLLAVSIGGELLEIAKRDGVPYIQMPDMRLQPRAALGFAFRALAKALGRNDILKESAALSSLDVLKAEAAGRNVATFLSDGIPILYASARNAGIAHVWKVKLNEGAKIPAFDNMFPELTHNEMVGFDVAEKTKPMSWNMKFLFLRDGEDTERIVRRMDITQKLLTDRGFLVLNISLEGTTRLEKTFSSLFIADWTALALAEKYGVDSENVQMIEDLKQKMKDSR